MAEDREVTKEEVKELTPDPLKRFHEDNVNNLDELFPGDRFVSVRENLREGQVAQLPGSGKENGAYIAATLGEDGRILAMAAAVSRTPKTSEKYLKDDVPDLKRTGSLTRDQQIELYRKIYSKEGIINNAIKKKASIVSQDGSFLVRSAKQGKRPRQKVVDDLTTLLTFWAENVNGAPDDAAITGSRGVTQVVRRGSRQALITGDLFAREQWGKTNVPGLNKKFSLPMFIHAIPSEEVEIAEEFKGLGIELFYWKPDSSKISKITGTKDPAVRKMVTKAFPTEKLSKLKKDGKVLLESALLIHIKNGGTDVDSYGQSDVEAALTDIAYARALKSLDFVTIDSLINRMLVIKIGDENPDSAFHNLASAQQRVNVFSQLIGTIGPNMMILWAGHDIDTKDIGAHNTILQTDERHNLAKDLTKLATGVPDPLLTGSADGGNAVAWAGFIALAAVAEEMQDEWAQALSQLGVRIAEQNGFKDVNVIWQFSKKLLADREANAKLAIQVFDRGGLSYQSLLEEMGKDFDAEKARKRQEDEKGDKELFEPPLVPTGGPGGNQGIEPTNQPGRPDGGTTTKVGPERDREDRNMTGKT